MPRLLAIFLFAWFPIGAVSAQTPQLSFDHLGVEDGLPENTITALLQDRSGYIWAGTQQGLTRYDGYQLKTYYLETAKRTNIKVLYQDWHGTIWVGTRQGIYRFDKVHDYFTRVFSHSSDPNSLSAGLIASIHLDRQDNLWVVTATNDPDWYVMDRINSKTGRMKHFSKIGPYRMGISGIETATSFLEDSRGQLWVGTNNGLQVYDPRTDSFTSFLNQADTARRLAVTALFESFSEPGILWAGGQNQKKDDFLVRFDTRNHTHQIYGCQPPANVGQNKNRPTAKWELIEQIVEDRNGKLWMETLNSLIHFDRRTQQFTAYIHIPEQPLKGNFSDFGVFFQPGIVEQEDGTFWIATSQGLLVFDPKSGRYIRHQHRDEDPHSLQRNMISRLLKDRSGSTWVGTHAGGLHRLNRHRTQFIFFRSNQLPMVGYRGGSVISIAEGEPGTRWLNTQSGLIRWDLLGNRFRQIPLHDNSKVELFEENAVVDHQGMVWCSRAFDGFYRYDPKTGNVRHFQDTPSEAIGFANLVQYMYVDRAGDLWVGGNQLSRWNKATARFVHYPFPESMQHPGFPDPTTDWINTIFEDRQGILWMGTGLGVIIRFDRSKNLFTHYYDIHHINSTITGFYEDRQGRFWANGSLGGLQLFDRKTAKSQWFTEKDGLLQNFVSSIQEDETGHLWLGHQRGITQFNPQTHAVRQFTLDRGLPAIHFAGGSLRTKAGQFIFGSQEGMLVFKPEDLVVNSIPPQVVIESIQVSNPAAKVDQAKATELWIDGQSEISLAYNENKLIVRYVGLHYANAPFNTYAYRMDGYDQDWVNVGTQRTAIYTNLDPGTYTFQVKAANADGVWNEKGTSIIVTILPPWWRTWWAYLLYTLVIGGSIWAFIEYRSRTLRRENQVLEEKVTLRTSQLQHKSNELEHSLETLKTTQTQLVQKEKMASLGELTAGIAHEIQNPLNFVNNFSELSSELVEELEEEHQKSLRDADLEVELLTDLKDNLHKILHHGNRAASIVKGMLEHARSSTGEGNPLTLTSWPMSSAAGLPRYAGQGQSLQL